MQLSGFFGVYLFIETLEQTKLHFLHPYFLKHQNKNAYTVLNGLHLLKNKRNHPLKGTFSLAAEMW